MKSTQQSFFKEPRPNTKRWWIEKQSVYGGALSYRKCKRPFSSKLLTHTVFKARVGSATAFTRSQLSIRKLLYASAKRYAIKLESFSIQKDHLHILTRPESTRDPQHARKNFIKFLRYFSAEMGRAYARIFLRLGITKPKQGLWLHRPFTRLVSWGRKSLGAVKRYIRKNTFESMGLIEYSPRKHRLSRFLLELDDR